MEIKTISQVIQSSPQKESTPLLIKSIESFAEERYPNRPEDKKSWSKEEYVKKYVSSVDYKGAIPKRYKEAKVTHPKVIDFMNRFDGSKGLYIYGECGTGKTHNLYGLYKVIHANCILNWFKTSDIRPKSVTPIFTNITNFFSDLKQSFDDKDSEKQIVEQIQDDRFMFLDDFGAEKVSDWTVEASYRLLNYRYNWMIPTFISSNLSLEQLADKIGDRFASRIVEMCEIIKFEGEDLRMKNRS